jgi:hypothetical protein
VEQKDSASVEMVSVAAVTDGESGGGGYEVLEEEAAITGLEYWKSVS